MPLMTRRFVNSALRLGIPVVVAMAITGAPAQIASFASVADPATQKDSDADLSEILRQWDQSSAKINLLHCRFQRHKYDHTFHVEFRGEGTIAVDREGRAAFRRAPVRVDRNGVSRRKGDDGSSYGLREDGAERYYWTDVGFVWIDEEARTFMECNDKARRFADRPPPPNLPEGADASSASQSSFVTERGSLMAWFRQFTLEFVLARPFLLGMKDRRHEYDVSLFKEKTTATQVCLSIRPLRSTQQRLYREAKLLLNRNDWTPAAVQLIAANGNSEMVYVFSDLAINPVDPQTTKLLEPDLTGYRHLGKGASRQTAD